MPGAAWRHSVQSHRSPSSRVRRLRSLPTPLRRRRCASSLVLLSGGSGESGKHRRERAPAPAFGACAGKGGGYAGGESHIVTSQTLTDRAAPALAHRLGAAPAAWTFLAVAVHDIGIYFLLP